MLQMSAAEQAYLEDENLKLAFLLHFDISPALRLTTWHADLNYQFQTYKASGQILGIDPQRRSSSLSNRSFKISLGSTDQELPAVLFDDNTHNREVTLYLAFIDSNNQVAFAHVFERMLTDALQDTESPDKSELTLTLSTRLASFEQTAGIVTNLKSHQRYYPGDMFFEFTSTVRQETFWGREVPNNGTIYNGGGGAREIIGRPVIP